MGLLRLLDGQDWPGSVSVVESIEESGQEFDIIYVNRLQKERRISCEVTEEEYGRLDLTDLEHRSPRGCVLHPLPKRAEMPAFVVDDPRCRLWEHVDITYMTRQWLIDQYLCKPEERSLNFFIKPLLLPKLWFPGCDCASALVPDAMKVQPHGRAPRSLGGTDGRKRPGPASPMNLCLRHRGRQQPQPRPKHGKHPQRLYCC